MGVGEVRVKILDCRLGGGQSYLLRLVFTLRFGLRSGAAPESARTAREGRVTSTLKPGGQAAHIPVDVMEAARPPQRECEAAAGSESATERRRALTYEYQN